MHIRLRQINNTLLGLIVLVNLYIVLTPLAPAVIFWWQGHHEHRQQALTTQIHQKSASSTAPVAPQPNHLVVPSMLLNTPILEGTVANQYKTLNQGIWRWPTGSTPDKGGNTVLIGHRFTYTNPRGIFYFLNKVSLGNEIAVYWNNKEYLYKVSAITEVPSTDTAIENNTPDARLTLFTCTPLWNPHNRLVVVAKLEQTP